MSRAIFVTLACLVATVAAVKDLENYSFDKYLVDFNLKYSAAELPMRQKLFESELARVKEHNSKNLKWKESVNKFSVLTADEKKAFFGRNKHAANHQDVKKLKSEHALPADFVMKPVSALPTEVDWRTKGVVSAVKDQGSCGSCWAFGSTATIESYVAMASGLLFDLSVQQMAMCAPNPDNCGGNGACQGSTAELAFDYVTGSKGLLQEYQYGYVSYYGKNFDCAAPGASKPVATIDGYTQLPGNNYTAVMNTLATIGPLAINVDASTWGAYKSGVFSGCSASKSDINHVVMMVGYGVDAVSGDKYWLVRNSWSPTWGEAGYIRLLRTDSDDANCATDTTPQDGVACDGQTDPVQVCGMCGAIYDTSYPLNARAL